MKIIVDKMPESPRDCIFSELTIHNKYVCRLRPYVEKINSKPKCICKSVDKCDNLTLIGD